MAGQETLVLLLSNAALQCPVSYIFTKNCTDLKAAYWDVPTCGNFLTMLCAVCVTVKLKCVKT